MTSKKTSPPGEESKDAPAAPDVATEGLAPDERSSLARLLQRLVDLNAVARDAVSHAKAVTQSEIEKTRVLQDRLRHLAGPERSGLAFDAMS